MGDNPIQFESIKVEGYRGRNFILKMRAGIFQNMKQNMKFFMSL